MGKIIDFRLRPPLYGYLEMGIWNPKGVEIYNSMQGVEPALSARARSMDMMLSEMKAAGITLGVMNGRQCSGFRGEVTNEQLARICNEYPGRFVALSGANPFRGPENVKEADLYIREHGFKGISLDPPNWDEPMYADDERLYPYCEVCLKHDVPLVLTMGPLGGTGIEYADVVQIDHLAAKFPELKIVIAHGCWPNVTQICGVAARRPNIYLMPDMYHIGLPGEADYTRAIETVAQHRFIFASAYPGRPMGIAVESYKALPISAVSLQEVMYGTAARLLKLDG